MKIAAIYDIHGNLPALEAVLRDIAEAKVDRIVVGGDVMPGPMPHETLVRLLDLDLPTLFIEGNGDRVVRAQMKGEESPEVPASFREVIRWNARQLQAADEQVLASWPPTLRIRVPTFGEVLFCHATPRSDTEIFTRLTPQEHLLPVFEGLHAPLVVCGHTHMQFDRIVGTTRVLNAGSVGMPFGEPGAYWLLLGPEPELRRTHFDLEEAAAHIRKTGYPQAEEFATRNVLHPPSEAAMLDAFTKNPATIRQSS